MRKNPLIGVLGGMGPLATVDFMHKLVQDMPAARDQEHVPVVVWNVPQVPDRQNFLAGGKVSPLPAMLEGVERLVAAGATRLVIPCNTAHHWFDDLAASTPVPFIHIAEATLAAIRAATAHFEGTVRLGLIATRGLLASGLYQRRFAEAGIDCIVPSEEEVERFVTPGCYAVKAGDVEAGGKLLDAVGDSLCERGATHLILGCTEVPLAYERIRSRYLPVSIDTNRALARACIDYWQVARNDPAAV